MPRSISYLSCVFIDRRTLVVHSDLVELLTDLVEKAPCSDNTDQNHVFLRPDGTSSSDTGAKSCDSSYGMGQFKFSSATNTEFLSRRERVSRELTSRQRRRRGRRLRGRRRGENEVKLTTSRSNSVSGDTNSFSGGNEVICSLLLLLPPPPLLCLSAACISLCLQRQRG